MESITALDTINSQSAETWRNVDFSFLPRSLTTQCQRLIEAYHELHGYACLPDMLWKSRLTSFIETHHEFRKLLRKASTTRSAKTSNENFVTIAKTILSMEILASNFSGWSSIYPQAGLTAHALLLGNRRSVQMPLMDFYLYPPKYASTAAIAALVPHETRAFGGAQSSHASSPGKPDERPRDGIHTQDKNPPGYAGSHHQTSYSKPVYAPATPLT